jgi:hypothetical protein
MNNSFQKRSKRASKRSCNVTHIASYRAVVVVLLFDTRGAAGIVTVVTVAPFVGAFLCRRGASRRGGLGFGTLLLELLLARFLFSLLSFRCLEKGERARTMLPRLIRAQLNTCM